jgi:hypothetical protein
MRTQLRLFAAMMIVAGSALAQQPLPHRPQPASTPAASDQVSQLSTDVSQHWASVMTVEGDFVKTVNALIDEAQTELRAVRAENAELRAENERLKALPPKPSDAGK